MVSRVPREFVQATSAALVVTGIYLMTATSDQWLGVSFIALSVWVINMSESILLQKVQTEMTACLETVRKKQDVEVQDLLYFLRSSNIAADPFHSLEAAKLFIDKLPFEVDVEDITLTGSLANYNWSSYSDVDLHIIIDFTDLLGYE